MRVPVLWCSRHDEILARGYADQGLLEAMLDRSLWRPPDAVEFEHHEVRGDFPDVEGALVIINCRTHASADDVAWFTGQLDRLAWSVVLLCGDEEWIFPWREVHPDHPHRLWFMQARPEHQGLGTPLPGGWYPGTRELLAAADAEARPLDWFFGGQVNHDRRQECVAVLRKLDGGRLVTSARYLQEKVPKPTYFALMASAKVIPCPSGPYSVDCARTFEALEAGCVPVADTVTARAGAFDYWRLLFGYEPPFPRVADWHDFPAHLDDILGRWERTSLRCWAFWQQYKRDLTLSLDSDLRFVSRQDSTATDPDDAITVIVTTSPVPSHPSTEHIETVIASVRAQLPLAEVVIVADGVRPEQEHRRADYELYLRRLLWLCNFEWHNVVPVVLDDWRHQANATKEALNHVETPLLLFVEHDTPLVGPIDWPGLRAFVASGEANVVRFHEDVTLNPAHERVIGPLEDKGGLPLRRTSAWWQRPHLASTRFYRERIMPLFSDRARSMIEEPVYALVETACRVDPAHWWDWRLWVYSPDDEVLGMRRSGHLDSRGDDPKYPMVIDYGGAKPTGGLPAGVFVP